MIFLGGGKQLLQVKNENKEEVLSIKYWTNEEFEISRKYANEKYGIRVEEE